MPAQNTQVLPKDTAKKVMPAEEEEGGDTFDKRIVYGATDTILYDQEAQKLYLVNEAYFEYETMSLKAKYIVMDYASNTVTAYGDKDSLGKPVGVPVFKDRDQEFSSEKIIYNLKTKKRKIFNVLTKQGELLVFGQEIKKDSNDIIYMKNLRCIPCQFEDAKTVFQATRAKIIPND